MYWQSVFLVCKSVVIEPFSRLILRSKNATLFFDDSNVNWSFCKNLLNPSINFFSSASPCISIKKILSVYLNNTNGGSSYILRKSMSCIHINTGIWKRRLSPSSSTRDLLPNFIAKLKNKMFSRTNSANLTRSLVGIFEEVCSSNLIFKAKIHFVWYAWI